MIIEQIFPQVVAEKSTLRHRLIAKAIVRGISNTKIEEIIELVPDALIVADAFLDKMTSIWRYEFGLPYDIGKELVFGTQMWPPVQSLFNALWCAHTRLSEVVRNTYLLRLAELSKHQAVLAEMIPGNKIDSEVAINFEVSGQGVGNQTVDWVIGPHDGRTVLLDVKSRSFDFVKQIERYGSEISVPIPNHEPALLFRSVEKKFLCADPDFRMQGVWVITALKQDAEQLSAAFNALSSEKVHFAIFGDWLPDAYVLVKRVQDEQYLRSLFHIEKSSRFTFMQGEIERL